MTGSTSLRELLREESTHRRFVEDVRPSEETEIYQSFSFGRTGLRPQLMLSFVKSDGHYLVLPYADLRAIMSVNSVNVLEASAGFFRFQTTLY